MEDTLLETGFAAGEAETIPGIVIHGRFEAPRRPAIAAFIWGGKVAPVPMLPYGRQGVA